MRLILLLVFAIVLALVLQRMARQPAKRPKAMPRHSARQREQAKPTITMVACEYCHVHVPQDEAIYHDGRNWCSLDHAKKGSRQ